MWLNEFLSTLVPLTLFCVGVALFIFALIGIHKVYSDYKKSKWQKEYGTKLKEDTKRNQWENMERLRDKVFLLEELIKENGTESNIDRIDKIISDVNYDTRYSNSQRNESKWMVHAVSSMSGGFGSSEKAQADIQDDFEQYEKKREQELREKLDEMIKKGR